MREPNEIKELVEEIRKLREELPQIIQKATRRWLPIIVMLIIAVLSVFQPDIRNGCLNAGRWLLEQIREDGSEDRQPQIPSFSKLMEEMENEDMTDIRFGLLESNLDYVPSSLSLNTLNRIIKLFYPENYRVEVVKLLYSRLEANYSADEYETFKNLFNPYKQLQLKKMGLYPKKPR